MMKSDRKSYVGAYVTPEVRAAAVKEARRLGLSLSRFIHELLRRTLVDGEEA